MYVLERRRAVDDDAFLAVDRDLRAHRPEEPGEVDDLGADMRVPQRGSPLRQRPGDERVLRRARRAQRQRQDRDSDGDGHLPPYRE